MRRSAGFTLLETIIALGVLAIGATTALALFVAAASSGRRAEHHVTAASVADSVLSEVEVVVDGSFDVAGLEVATDIAARPQDPGDGPMRAVPRVDPRAVAKTGGGKAPMGGPAPPPPPKKPDSTSGLGPPRPFSDDPFAGAKTYVWKKGQTPSGHPDYKYDVLITPVGGPPDDPWEFLVEVVVRWTEKGARRDAVYQTVILRKLSHLDNLDAQR